MYQVVFLSVAKIVASIVSEKRVIHYDRALYCMFEHERVLVDELAGETKDKVAAILGAAESGGRLRWVAEAETGDLMRIVSDLLAQHGINIDLQLPPQPWLYHQYLAMDLAGRLLENSMPGQHFDIRV